MSIVSGSPPSAPASMGGLSSAVEDVSTGMSSLRFDGSSYLSRTFGTATSSDRFTLSMWVKRSGLAKAVGTGHNTLLTAYSGNDNTTIKFAANSQLPLNGFSVDWSKHGISTSNWRGTQSVFRDISSWYHLIWNFDSSPFKNELWVNGLLDNTYGNLSGYSDPNSTQINNALVHNIGRYPHTNTYYFNGYMADIHLIDGEALSPEATGELISDIWRPKAFSGEYGANGFHLDFHPDNMVYNGSGVLTEVKDTSGNGNHWTAH